MHFGCTGLLNFGQVGFMLVGADGVAVTVATFHAPLLAGAAVGIAMSVLLALLLCIPILRLRAIIGDHDYRGGEISVTSTGTNSRPR